MSACIYMYRISITLDSEIYLPLYMFGEKDIKKELQYNIEKYIEVHKNLC